MVQTFTATFRESLQADTKKQSTLIQHYTQANVDIRNRKMGDDQTLQYEKNPIQYNP
jgi:hypothetical protein